MHNFDSFMMWQYYTNLFNYKAVVSTYIILNKKIVDKLGLKQLQSYLWSKYIIKI